MGNQGSVINHQLHFFSSVHKGMDKEEIQKMREHRIMAGTTYSLPSPSWQYTQRPAVGVREAKNYWLL